MNSGEIKDELVRRIASHLARRPAAPDVVLAWDAYLTGLSEWGVLGLDEYLEVRSLLPDQDRRAVVEISLGDHADEHPDLGRVEAEPAKVA